MSEGRRGKGRGRSRKEGEREVGKVGGCWRGRWRGREEGEGEVGKRAKAAEKAGEVWRVA